jgi:hypothetical protein
MFGLSRLMFSLKYGLKAQRPCYVNIKTLRLIELMNVPLSMIDLFAG